MANEKNYSVNDLKATAYDILANIDFLQKKLAEINNEIARLSKLEKENGSANDNNNK